MAKYINPRPALIFRENAHLLQFFVTKICANKILDGLTCWVRALRATSASRHERFALGSICNKRMGIYTTYYLRALCAR
jgi:hypothetical protein